MSSRAIKAFTSIGASCLQGSHRLSGRKERPRCLVLQRDIVVALIAAFTSQSPSIAQAESVLRTAPSAGDDRAQALSASASIRIEVVVAPRLQIRNVAGERATLSSNRGSILVACDVRAHCPAQPIGDRGIVDLSIARPVGGYTIAQP